MHIILNGATSEIYDKSLSQHYQFSAWSDIGLEFLKLFTNYPNACQYMVYMGIACICVPDIGQTMSVLCVFVS